MTQPHDAFAPAFSVAPHVTDPTGLVAGWWTDPPGVLLQLTTATRGTTEMAEWLVGPGFERLVQRFPESRDLRVILDMRPMTGRSATARSLLVQHSKLARGRLAHVVLVPSLQLGPAYLKVVEAAVLLVRAAGLRVDIDHSLEGVIERHGLRPAEAGELAPGLGVIADVRPAHGPVGNLTRP